VWNFIKPYPHRGSGTYISPNHLAGFLEMLLPLGLAYAMAGRQKHLTKILLGYASLVIITGIGVTVSRGSWVASAAALLALLGLLALRRNHRIQALAMLILLV